jgi:hypothetical protein
MDIFAAYKTKKPEVFLRLVGMNIGTFQIILEKFRKEIEQKCPDYSDLVNPKPATISTRP